MGDWYSIGLCVGLGVGFGVLLVGALAATRTGLAFAVLAASAVGFAVGLIVGDLAHGVAGVIGALAGSVGSAELVRGALRRGGTRGATALLVGTGAVALGALALVPGVGYAEALAVPALAARLRRRRSERHAGLRILARDE